MQKGDNLLWLKRGWNNLETNYLTWKGDKKTYKELYVGWITNTKSMKSGTYFCSTGPFKNQWICERNITKINRESQTKTVEFASELTWILQNYYH